jgi:transcriptional regulator with XRE-family HTH domain
VDNISRRLREERQLRGWSQRDLARETGVNTDTISGIETGQHEPRPSTLRKLAEGLGIEVRDLFMESVLSGKAKAPETGHTLANFLNERCGHSYLASGREEIQALFDQLDGVEDEERKRRELGLVINAEYNTICNFPRNVSREERLAMRGMIRDAIPDVSMKHNIALVESGLFREYQEETKRIFEVVRVLSDEERTA